MTSDPRAIALADLHHAILTLAPRLQGADDLSDLSQLQAAADRLSHRVRPAASGLRDYDPQRFQRLLELTGPRMAGTLLAHLVDDLSNCRTILLAGANAADWAALREGTHVLVSLAGSVGALSLQALAETLNAAAHRQDNGTVTALVPDLLAELEALIDLVRATPATARIPS